MKTMLKTGGNSLCALAICVTSLARPVQAAAENPLPTTSVKSAVAGQDARQVDDSELAAQVNWRAYMSKHPVLERGCHHASYPNFVWEPVNCKAGQPRVHPTHRTLLDGEPEVVGNGTDYAAYAKNLIGFARGSFPTVRTKSEKGDDPQTGSGALNEYSLQINTNARMSTSACDGGNSGCKVWQQFVYATDYYNQGEGAVLMQYWLIGYGSCPGSWNQYGDDCFLNSPSASTPDIPVTDLANLSLEAFANPGGDDIVALYNGSTEAWSVELPDSMLDISSVWNKAEFNMVGDGSGTRADFNSGTAIKVKLELWNADVAVGPLTCLSNAGTTGETNNLNLGTCSTGSTKSNGDTFSYIEFVESN